MTPSTQTSVLGRPVGCSIGRSLLRLRNSSCFFQIAKVAAGSIHSVALTTDGEVFIWGNYRDNSGAFGISPNNAGFMTLPMKLSLPGNIMDIACGADHTLMLDAEVGDLFLRRAADL